MAKKSKKSKQVESLKHRDKRKNIPTEELRDFVREDEARPKEVRYPGLLYARDPSLDPQQTERPAQTLRFRRRQTNLPAPHTTHAGKIPRPLGTPWHGLWGLRIRRE